MTTANEIHIPVGRPVVVELRSADVIHSFWLPNLSGKRDLIPGDANSVWFQADTPGVYRGHCAEFCGHQHAKMAFLMIAEPPDRFARVAGGAAGYVPRTPADSVAMRGREVFLVLDLRDVPHHPGTPAGSRVGPDLTHLASRRTIAAGTLPNTSAATWRAGSSTRRRIKPGVSMPPSPLSGPTTSTRC